MTVQTRRARREQERKNKPVQQGSPQPQRSRGSRPGWIVPVVIIAIAVAAILLARANGVFDPVRVSDINDPKFSPSGVIGTQYPDEGKNHVPDGQPVQYKTTPPTSGNHWATPMPWGSYDQQQPLERTTHNMEHGGIVIMYNGLGSNEVAQLKVLVSTMRTGEFNKIVLEPSNSFSDAKIALSAWTWQLKLQAYDEASIIKFVRAHYNGPDAPEPNVG